MDNFRAAADSDTKNGSVGPLFHSCFQKVNLEIPETDQEDLRIQKTADGYEIETKKSVTVSATLPGAAEGATLLAVSFEVENQKASHDMFIRINGQTNRLTGINHTYANGNTQFNYLVTMKEDGTVFIRMGKGHYILKNFETWTGMAQPLEKNGAAVQSGGYPDWRNNSNIRRRWHHRRAFRGKRRIPHHQHSIR